MRVNDEPLNDSNIWQLENADEIAHVFAKQGIPLRRTSMTIAEILQQAKTLRPDSQSGKAPKGRDRNKLCHCGSNRKFKRCHGR
jgi:hypothetical protein